MIDAGTPKIQRAVDTGDDLPALWARRRQVAVPPLPEHDLGVSSNSLERMLQPRAAARLLEMVLRKPLLKRCSYGFCTWRCAVVRQATVTKTLVLSPCNLLAEVLRHVFHLRKAQRFQEWRATAAWLAVRQQQDDFRAELRAIADQDAAVSTQLMACAEGAAARARSSGFRAAGAVLGRLASVRMSAAVERWKAFGQEVAVRKRFQGLQTAAVRCLQHVVRARMGWAWARWHCAKWPRSRSGHRETPVKEVPGSFLAARSLPFCPLAARAEQLLRLKVRLAWHLLAAAQVVLRATGVRLKVETMDYGRSYERTHGRGLVGLSVPVSEKHLDAIQRLGTVLKGPIEIDPKTPLLELRGRRFTSANQALRKIFQLYANVRPCRFLEGVKGVKSVKAAFPDTNL
ncbi:unnamed protein product, partial [Cladocopium goreaui]